MATAFQGKMPPSYKGKSTRLGYGGRAAKMQAMGVPGGVIGNIARSKQAAPGMKNYHGSSHPILKKMGK